VICFGQEAAKRPAASWTFAILSITDSDPVSLRLILDRLGVRFFCCPILSTFSPLLQLLRTFHVPGPSLFCLSVIFLALCFSETGHPRFLPFFLCAFAICLLPSSRRLVCFRILCGALEFPPRSSASLISAVLQSPFSATPGVYHTTFPQYLRFCLPKVRRPVAHKVFEVRSVSCCRWCLSFPLEPFLSPCFLMVPAFRAVRSSLW